MSGEEELAKWTILVYIAGDRTLANFGVESLKQLRGAAGKDVVVAAQFYAAGQTHAHRLIFDGKDTNGSMWSYAQDIPARDMADPKTLSDFILWVYDQPQCQAQHYCLVMWGHGPELLFDEYFSPDGKERTSFMTPPRLGKGLASAKQRSKRNFDIIGIDACSMSMVEVAYEISEYADFLVASQEDVPDLSFPYNKLVPVFGAGYSPAEICRALPGQYVAAYRDYIVNKQTSMNRVTLASIRLGLAARLVPPLRRLTTALVASACDPRKRRAILNARRDAKDFVSGLYVDLCDFCEGLDAELSLGLIPDEELQAACREVCELIRRPGDDRLLIANEAPGVGGSHGLSIYFPYSQDVEDQGDVASNDFAIFALVKGGSGTQGVKGGSGTQGVKDGMDVLGQVRRKRISETEAYFPELKLPKECWYDFIVQAWSRILVNEEPASLDVSYSAAQCARNLSTIKPCPPPSKGVGEKERQKPQTDEPGPPYKGSLVNKAKARRTKGTNGAHITGP